MIIFKLANILAIIMVVVVIIISNKKYKNIIGDLDKKEYKIKALMPLGLIIYNKYKHKAVFKNEKIEGKIHTLYGRRNYEEKLKLFWADKIALGMGILIGALILSLLASLSYSPEKKNIKYIEKPVYEEGRETVSLRYEIIFEDIIKEKNISINLPRQLPSEKKIEEILIDTSNRLPTIILGENKSINEVRGKLNLITSYSNEEIEINWSTNRPEIVSENGEILHRNIKKEPEKIKLVATLKYGNRAIEKQILLDVYHKKVSNREKIEIIEEEFLEEIKEKINNQNKIDLPKEKGRAKINWYKNRVGSNPIKILLGGIFTAVILMILKNYELNEKLKERETNIKKELPEFINKLTLLINAGLNLSGALKRIVEDYKDYYRNDKKLVLYEELIIAVDEINVGISEIKAYEIFA